MNLAFSTQFPPTAQPAIANQPTHFVEKIWKGFIENQQHLDVFGEYVFNKHYDFENMEAQTPKRHTFKQDKANRWQVGNLIHFYINARSKNQFRFAPVVPVLGIQKIEINWFDYDAFRLPEPNIYINGNWIVGDKKLLLMQNDGFDTPEQFYAYFNQNFEGKIIHWTDLKY